MKTVCVLIAIVLVAAYFGPAEPSKTESAMPADQTLMMAAPALALQQ